MAHRGKYFALKKAAAERNAKLIQNMPPEPSENKENVGVAESGTFNSPPRGVSSVRGRGGSYSGGCMYLFVLVCNEKFCF